MLLVSCSGKRLLPRGEKLYTGADVQLISQEKVNSKAIQNTIESAIRPTPNKSFLGMRPKVWRYLKAGENPQTKFKKWLKKRGEEPILLSDVKPFATSKIIDARLFNIGVFNSKTTFGTDEKKRTARIIFTSQVHKPYRIKKVQYAISNKSIQSKALSIKEYTYLKPGVHYNLDLLKIERSRIDDYLKDHGYFYFNADYLKFIADTSDTDKSVSLKLILKENTPASALAVYRINRVKIDQNYSLNEEENDEASNVVEYKDITLKMNNPEMDIKPSELNKSVYLSKDSIYSRENHNATLKRLMSLNNYKFVRVQFNDADTGFLDVSVYMTPMQKRTFRTELEVITKSNNYTGPQLNMSILNRNTFQGAEILKLGFSGSYESQFGEKNKNLYSYSYSPELQLTLPRLITPFKIKQKNNRYVPKTNISLSYSFIKRVNYFDMRTLQLNYGYKWKKNILSENELIPLNVSYSLLGNISSQFKALLNENPYLKKSYDDQFITSTKYIYTYNEQLIQGKKQQYFFQLSSEVAGNTLSLIHQLTGEKASAEDPSKFFGTIYSQFARLSLDGRMFWNTGNNEKLALRFFAGVAKSYGNTSALPYSRQFFSGGPNSIRAFHINSLGPGQNFQDVGKRGFLQSGGDIKLEWNAEYRFGIYSLLKGALFVDAGNIWTINTSDNINEGDFSISDFHKELAVGAGVGFRFDVSFFVLRFDLAMPLRKPWLEENKRWVIDEIDFPDSNWRSENLILNVAIGYPF